MVVILDVLVITSYDILVEIFTSSFISLFKA